MGRTHLPPCHLLSPLPVCPQSSGADHILGRHQGVHLHFFCALVLTLWLSQPSFWFLSLKKKKGYILIQSSSESESVGWRVLFRSPSQLWECGRAWLWVFKPSLPLICCESLGKSLNLNLSVHICNRRTVILTSWTCEDNSNDIRRYCWVLAGCHGLCWALSTSSSISFAEQLGEV